MVSYQMLINPNLNNNIPVFHSLLWRAVLIGGKNEKYNRFFPFVSIMKTVCKDPYFVFDPVKNLINTHLNSKNICFVIIWRCQFEFLSIVRISVLLFLTTTYFEPLGGGNAFSLLANRQWTFKEESLWSFWISQHPFHPLTIFFRRHFH